MQAMNTGHDGSLTTLHANGVIDSLNRLETMVLMSGLEIPVKAKFDGEYVQNMSLWFDIKIFLKTIIKVFKRDGVVEGNTSKETVEK